MCVNDHRGRPSQRLDMRHYLRLRLHCSPEILEAAWSKWEKLGGNEFGEAQRTRQFETVKNMKTRCELYRELWNGTQGTAEEFRKFHYKWLGRGTAEINSILKTGVEMEELAWDSCREFKELYAPLPVFDCGCAGQKFTEATNLTASMVPVGSPVCKQRKVEERVIYGTPECEPCREAEGLTYGSLEIELESAIRQSLSPEL
jgi:hypothetical protein